MLLKIGLALVALIAAFLAFAATRPASYRVARKTVVAAPPAVAYAQVVDFHKWPAWSPWAKLDPAMKTTFGGAPEGTGAVYEWNGNDKVGEGRMTITDARPGQAVDIRLEFMRPMTAVNQTAFAFAPAASGTEITWTMEGQNNFMAKAFSVFMDFEKMVGGDFERGLASLKAVSEAQQPAAIPAVAR